MTEVVGPPRGIVCASAATAAKASRHQFNGAVPARRARAVCKSGPKVATAAGRAARPGCEAQRQPPR
eukprot:7684757-Lingulodinium_polyedra.AAC.1